MRVVYVTSFESGSITMKSAGAQCTQSPFMCQFIQRIYLLHKLRKLTAAEEIFNSTGKWLRIDNVLWGRIFHILNSHSFFDNTRHSGKSNAKLILQ